MGFLDLKPKTNSKTKKINGLPIVELCAGYSLEGTQNRSWDCKSSFLGFLIYVYIYIPMPYCMYVCVLPFLIIHR